MGVEWQSRHGSPDLGLVIKSVRESDRMKRGSIEMFNSHLKLCNSL